MFQLDDLHLRQFELPKERIGKVWTFCISCKRVEETEVNNFFYVHGIWPYCNHCKTNNSQTGLQVFDSKKQAEIFKQNYKEMVFK
jgi:hypothetical protein